MTIEQPIAAEPEPMPEPVTDVTVEPEGDPGTIGVPALDDETYDPSISPTGVAPDPEAEDPGSIGVPAVDDEDYDPSAQPGNPNPRGDEEPGSLNHDREPESDDTTT